MEAQLGAEQNLEILFCCCCDRQEHSGPAGEVSESTEPRVLVCTAVKSDHSDRRRKD